MSSGLALALLSGLMAIANLFGGGHPKPPVDQSTPVIEQAPPIPAPSPESRAQAGMP